MISIVHEQWKSSIFSSFDIKLEIRGLKLDCPTKQTKKDGGPSHPLQKGIKNAKVIDILKDDGKSC